MRSLLTFQLSCLLVITVTGGQGYQSGYQEYEDGIGKLKPLPHWYESRSNQSQLWNREMLDLIRKCLFFLITYLYYVVNYSKKEPSSATETKEILINKYNIFKKNQSIPM